MKTVIRDNIFFQLNNEDSVDVFEGDTKITEISIELHFMLCLFNGYLEDYEIIELFKEAFCVNSRESKEMFNRIISKCEYILEKTDSSTRELEPTI